jgi:hypothetical protein
MGDPYQIAGRILQTIQSVPVHSPGSSTSTLAGATV